MPDSSHILPRNTNTRYDYPCRPIYVITSFRRLQAETSSINSLVALQKACTGRLKGQRREENTDACVSARGWECALQALTSLWEMERSPLWAGLTCSLASTQARIGFRTFSSKSGKVLTVFATAGSRLTELLLVVRG